MIHQLSKPASAYLELLGKEQSVRLLTLFAEIDAGKYAKDELHEFRLAGFPNPVFLRAIRADMQSFINTFIEPYLSEKPYLHGNGLIVDAGANIGYTALLFAQWWPGNTIVSIEPDLENCELARMNTREYPNIHIVHGALWNRSCMLCIGAGQEDGFVVREGNASNPQNATQAVTMPELMTRFKSDRIAFLKLNVEGSEKEIFSSACELWLPHTEALLVELHDGKNPGCSRAVFSALSAHSFAVAETASYGILFAKEEMYRRWYISWYRDAVYAPGVDKQRFPDLYLDA